MKRLATALFVLLSFSVHAQTIFHYGNDSVSVQEFLKAYHKNNAGPRTEKAFREYLDLYIASRLKVKEAKSRGYDSLPQMVSDLQGLRQQILPAYLNDKQSINKLTDEALQRSQKDIHLQHIFISTRNGDAAAALKKANDAMNELKKGKSFTDVAQTYSEDPSVRTNDGDLGWITVFSLPYELENLAYNTKPGTNSTLYQSKAGYHILKNVAERKDPGRMKVAQILIAIPPGSDENTKKKLKSLADSLYNRLQKSDEMSKLAPQFSNDVISAAANGQVPEFGIGQYEPAFENAAYGLMKDGEISKPFLTSHGYHIVKRISRVPVMVNRNDAKAMQLLQDKVEQSDRVATVRNAYVKKLMKNVHVSAPKYPYLDIWAYSDSILNYQSPQRPISINANSTLLTIEDKNVTGAEWISFAQTFRYKSDGSGLKTYPQLFDEFIQATSVDYYENHLENFNPEFRQQLDEFRDGNMFFEIMQREVWGPAQNDTTALEAYFNKNRSKYTWKPSADAVIFYATDPESAKAFSVQLKKSPASWHELVTDFSEKIAADSSRFELLQIPNPTRMLLKPGVITSVLVNPSDKTSSFAYIVALHNNREPRTFSEARGLVINEYQAELEKQWVATLKQKYPVTIDEKVVNDLVKNRKW